MYTWHGASKTYTKWMLVPLWISHIVFLVVIIGGIGYMMLEIGGRLEWGGVPPTMSAIMAFLLTALVLEPLEMVFQSYRILEPWLYLTSQAFKTLFGTILLIGGIYIVVGGTAVVDTVAEMVVIAFVVIIGFMTVSFYASLAYAAVVMHRHRKSSGYRSVKDRQGRDDESL